MKNNRNPPPAPVVQKVMAVLTTGRTVRAVLTGGMLLLLAAGLSKPATAQGRLDARYAATLGGLPIGRGAWVIDISDDHYTAAASGMTAGIMRIFASGQGTTAARGNIAGGNLLPVSYASNIKTEEKSEDVRMTLRGLNITEFSVTPPAPPNPERVPLAEAHRRGVSDPMTGSLMRVPGTGNPLNPEACNRSQSIFDGRLRFDLQFQFKRMDSVKAERGYEGPVVVCAVYFRPIAGYIPDRPAIRYLVDLRTIEVWLAPIAGTRVLVPFRMSIPTPLGEGLLQATQFVSGPRAARANPASAKTQ
jgi:hypothetical protein